jgi:hypothetical protein
MMSGRIKSQIGNALAPYDKVHNMTRCTFNNDFCGYSNQENMLYNFELIDHFPDHIISGKGMLFLDLIWSEWRRSSGARLVSSYYPDKNYRKGCFNIKFITWGHGITHLLLIQQDRVNRCIWQYDNLNFDHRHPSQFWRYAQIPVDLTNGPSKFFIEAQIYYYKLGFVAIDEIVLSYNECQYNNVGTNYCQFEY